MRKFIRRPIVLDRAGVSKSQLYVLIRSAEFPKPYKLGNGRAVAWLESEVEDWIAARVDASRRIAKEGQR